MCTIEFFVYFLIYNSERIKFICKYIYAIKLEDSGAPAA